MQFEEDPAHLSKSRLVPPAKSKKEVPARRHSKRVAVDFSSDEEDHVPNGTDKEEDPDDAGIVDPCGLSDDDLKAALLKHGVKAGPIVASTRFLYEKKLRKLLQSDGRDCLNGVKKGVLYSDGEEEEEGPKGAKEEPTIERLDQTQGENSQRPCAPRNREPCPKVKSGKVLKVSERTSSHCSQIPVGISRASSTDHRSGLGSGVSSGSQSTVTNSRSSFSRQAFSITRMVEETESRRSLSTCTDTESELSVQGHWPRSNRLDMYTKKDQSPYFTPEASPYKLRTQDSALWDLRFLRSTFNNFNVFQPPAEPVNDILKDLFPDTKTTPTGIYATCRRPIKGAAGRPIQYAYREPSASPTTLERQEVHRRLVPIHIQIVFFLVVVILLYLINICVEDNLFNPLLALLEGLKQRSDSEEGLLLHAETQDAPSLSG